MSRLTLITWIICSVCILAGSFGNTAWGQGCVQVDSIMGYPYVTGDWHYPCGNSGNVVMKYKVSDDGSLTAGLWFELEDTDFYRTEGCWGHEHGEIVKRTASNLGVDSQTKYRLVINPWMGDDGIDWATFVIRYYTEQQN